MAFCQALGHEMAVWQAIVLRTWPKSLGPLAFVYLRASMDIGAMVAVQLVMERIQATRSARLHEHVFAIIYYAHLASLMPQSLSVSVPW